MQQLTIEEFIQKEYSFDIKYEKTARLVLSDEHWYQQFLTYFHNFSFGFGYQFDKMRKLHIFRAYKIKCLQVSKEHFVNFYKTEPILALEELFQESIHSSQKKMLNSFKGESIGILYEAMQMLPEQKFMKFTTGPSLHHAYERAVELHATGDHEKNQEYLRMVLAGHIIKKERKNFIIIKKEEETEAKPISKQNKQTKEVSMTKWVRNSTLARSLKELYVHTCQCCGKSFPSRTGYLSEAHHVQPYNETHQGDDAWENMIVVCPTCHGWFDDFYFAIHPTTMKLHCFDPNHPLHGKLFQTKESHRLDVTYLNYAWSMFNKEDSEQKICL